MTKAITEFEVELAMAGDEELKAIFQREVDAGNEENALATHAEIVRRGLL